MPALGWSPSEFWAASLIEFFAAISGWNKMQGNADQGGWTDADIAEYEQLRDTRNADK